MGSQQQRHRVPVGLRTHLAHAALDVIAEDAGVDVLHVKGAAVDPSIGRPLTASTDADVLVRPTQVRPFLDALARHDWEHVTSFASGSAFEHAATFYHPSWGYTDVHRSFPGLTDGAWFDILWRGRTTTPIAGVPCTVPDLTSQRLLLLLHLARNGKGEEDPDYERAWGCLSAQERVGLRAAAHALGADVGLAAALGELDRYTDDPAYDLWRVFSGREHTRLAEWRARLKAAPTVAAKGRILLRAPLVNTDHLAMRLGRRPTRGEVLTEFRHRLVEAARETKAAIRR